MVLSNPNYLEVRKHEIYSPDAKDTKRLKSKSHYSRILPLPTYLTITKELFTTVPFTWHVVSGYQKKRQQQQHKNFKVHQKAKNILGEGIRTKYNKIFKLDWKFKHI